MNREQEKLLNKLQVCDFVLTEAALYLDTHPNNSMALDYYNRHNKMREDILKEYVEKYGPISKGENQSKNNWEWISNPWPWENLEDGE